MNQNLSTIDRVIRIAAGLGLVWAVLYVTMAVIFMWIFSAVGILLLASGMSGFDPMYNALNIKQKN